MRQTTQLEQAVDGLMFKFSRIRTATTGVVTDERARMAHTALGEIKQQIFRIEKLLDEVLYQ